MASFHYCKLRGWIPANGGDKGALPLAARSGFNTPIADSTGKIKIYYFVDHGTSPKNKKCSQRLPSRILREEVRRIRTEFIPFPPKKFFGGAGTPPRRIRGEDTSSMPLKRLPWR